jgi:NADH-quinone oxidoreductase subunit M
LGAIQINFWYAFLAAFTLIFGAAYTLWMVKRVFYGAVGNDQVAALSDLNKREFFILATLAVLVLALGVYPQAVTDMTNATVNELLTHFAQSKLPASLPAGL